MINASPALVQLLSDATIMMLSADLYEFSLINGTIIRCTTFDRPLIYNGNVYPVTGFDGMEAPILSRSKISTSTGLKSSKVDITIGGSANTLIGGHPFLYLAAIGDFTGAWVVIRRAFILPSTIPSQFNTPVACDLGGAGNGTIIRFSGEVGTISELGPLGCVMEVRDPIWYMNRGLPKNLINVSCWHTLFDTGCGITPGTNPNFRITGPVLAGSTITVIQTGSTQDTGIAGSPVAGPVLTKTSTNYNIPAVFYFARATYITTTGETLPSPETSLACPPNQILHAASPPSVTGATHWNLYVGTGTGDEQLQNPDPIPIGTNWTMPNGGISLTGRVPPQFPSNGWWSLGYIKFTTGVNAGISSFVEASASDGSILLRVPLLSPPAAGDTFILTAGCDKLMSTCQGKFNNIVHFSGFPFTPTPEYGG